MGIQISFDTYIPNIGYLSAKLLIALFILLAD